MRLLVLSLVFSALPLSAQFAPVRHAMVRFVPGTTSTILDGVVRPEGIVEYRVRVDAGETLVLMFSPALHAATMTVFGPSDSVPAFVGARDGDRFEAVAAATGMYRIRVGMAAGTARRSAYALRVHLWGANGLGAGDALDPVQTDTAGFVSCGADANRLRALCAVRVLRSRDAGPARVFVTPFDAERSDEWVVHIAETGVTLGDGTALASERFGDSWIITLAAGVVLLLPDALVQGE
jgi:hypothetical protein